MRSSLISTALASTALASTALTSTTMAATAIAAVIMASATPAAAQAPTSPRAYSVPAGELEQALQDFVSQSGQRVLYSSQLVSGLSSPGVSGNLPPEEALRTLLSEAGLEFRRTEADVLVLFDPLVSSDLRGSATTVDDVVVTGSLIRGLEQGSSPVIVIDRNQIDRDGHATVAQALAALPQNFGGSANEAAIDAGADRTAGNSTYANGVNLRGLGSDATLVLINGRRLAGTGISGDFTDLSSIPASAVKRIDVLLDGASALYGADAVGGVVNIILRTDYDGAETRLRAGSTSDGVSDELLFGQTVGRQWDTGSLMATYEYSDRGTLPVSARRLAGDADLRWRGGTDHRGIFSNPGNIVAFDPGTASYVVTHAIPSGQDGKALRPEDFLPGQTNLGNLREGGNVLPRQTRHSAFFAWSQDLGARARLSADVRYGLRKFETRGPAFPTLLDVTNANPYFASPVGASSHIIAYSFADDLGNPLLTGEAESLGASLGLDIDLFSDWRLTSYLAYASESGRDRVDGMVNSSFLSEALGETPDNPATPYSAARDGYFNPFGDGSHSSAAVLAFIGSGWSEGLSDTTISSANIQADGTIWNLPGGAMKLALGAAFREETFAPQVNSWTSGAAPRVGRRLEAERTATAVFAELHAPLVGDQNRRAGIRRLELTLAARYESYNDIGDTVSPKIGLLWEPSQELLLRASRSSSFRAPALRELNASASASPTFLPQEGRNVLSMILYGGNPDLSAETADTWSIGGEYRPGFLPGLRLGLNGFRTRFDDRIGQPTFENILTALSDPALCPFVRVVDPVANAQDRAAVQAILDLPTTYFSDIFPATSYGAIVDARFVNTASVEVEGLDAFGDYAFDVGPHHFDLVFNLTRMTKYDSRATPQSSIVSQIDRPHYPVGLRGRTQVNWTRSSWGASFGLNHVAGYKDDADGRIGSWTTADAQVRYAPEVGPLAGTSLALNVRNLFDRDPPFYDSPQGVGYDAANTDVVGRFVSFQLTKVW